MVSRTLELRVWIQVLLVVLIVAGSVAADGIFPWTSPRINGRTVSCWGRAYGFDSSVLPSRIVTQRENILAGPVEIAATICGRKVKWGRASVKSIGSDAESIRYITSASSDKLVVECRFETEFDGATRVDLTVRPKGQVKLDSLDIVFPLRRECATLFHHYPVPPVYQWDWPKKQMNSGAVPSTGMKLPFVFALWLGNDERGIQVFSESDRSWCPADPESAVTVSTVGRVTVLRLNALANYDLSASWKWSFGFVATPVKPFWTAHYKTHYCQDGGYGEEKSPGDGKPSGLDHLEAAGVNYLGCHEQWSDEQSLPRPKRPEELRSLIDGCHKRNIGLVLYAGLWMSTRSAEFNKDWRSTPIDEHFVYERSDNHDKCYYMCPNSGFPDLLLKTYAEAFKEYGMDGLYIDGPAATLPCTNAKHGCGYVGRDGKVHRTMPIWRPRETMKRFWRMVKSQPRPCIIVGHTSASLTLPILSFVDVYLDGEHLLAQRKLGTDEYPEEILRAEMSGHNFGIPAIQLPISGSEAERERARTVCLIHDALMEWHYWDMVEIWRAFDSFGMDKVEWRPYWKIGDLVTSDDSDIKVSAYLRKGHGALFVIANLGVEKRRAALAVKPRGLQLAPTSKLAASDAAGTDQFVRLDGGRLTVDVKPGAFRLISVVASKP